ncbi:MULTISPECIES: glycosyltransferase [unclassified Brucella]|uniref:glycosyltransferase n=1 Tax=unclassified Brucella TaxID=2632610 RepID=UPI000972C0E3|nr:MULTISPECIES: glycosyltransferase [unclassified Brucella]APY14912.1 hypothetical protein BKD02_02655 [Brucella sp. 09RB8910]
MSSLPFSLLMSVYAGDNSVYFDCALRSILNNSIRPNEIVLVIDGPVSEQILSVIDAYQSLLPIRVLKLKENIGLGPALAQGLLACSYSWVARFDSDDVCSPNRFLRQLEFIDSNPSVDAFSCPILEFNDALDGGRNVVRRVPVGLDNILRFAKWRSPLNHMAVMFKKESAIKAGNYRDEPSFEDYSLWLRMLKIGLILDNMDEILVFARAGRAIEKRRGGVRYIKNEIAMHKKLLEWGFMKLPECTCILLSKLFVRILPGKLRLHFYNVFMREKVK